MEDDVTKCFSTEGEGGGGGGLLITCASFVTFIVEPLHQDVLSHAQACVCKMYIYFEV